MWLLRLLGLLKLSEFLGTNAWLRRAGATLPGVAAGGIALLALYVASQILLVLDQIKSTEIRVVYGGVIALIGGGFAAFLYFHYVRMQKTAAPMRLPPDRLRALYAKYGVTPRFIALDAAAPRSKGKAGACIAVCGLAGGGKERLESELVRWAGKDARMGGASIAGLPPLTAHERENGDLLEMASGASLVLFTADQDLRVYETAFIRSLIARGKRVVIVIDQPRWHAEEDKVEVAGSIVAKFDPPAPQIVFTDAAPWPVTAIVRAAGGEEREELRQRAPDLSALVAVLPSALE